MNNSYPRLGYIYYLRCSNTLDILYVGSTIRSPERRFSGHLNKVKSSKSAIYKKIRRLQQKYGDNTFFLQIVERRVFKTKRSMFKLEKRHVKDLLKEDVKLYNSQHNFTEKCGCGYTYNIVNKSEHYKSTYHINFFKDNTFIANMDRLRYILSK